MKNLDVVVSVREEVESDVRKYLASADENYRTSVFTQVSYEKALLRRKTMQLEQELKSERNVLAMAETSPLAWKHVIKPYFDDLGITDGACKAIGKWLASYKRYITEKFGDAYFYEQGKYMHMYHYIMLKASKSGSQFFIDSRKNYRLWGDLENRMKEFCRVLFFREMQRVKMIYDRDGRLGEVAQV